MQEPMWERFVMVALSGDTTWFGPQNSSGRLYDVLELKTLIVPTPRGPAEMSLVSLLAGYRAGDWSLPLGAPQRSWHQPWPEQEADLKQRSLAALEQQATQERAEQMAQEAGASAGRERKGGGLILP